MAKRYYIAYGSNLNVPQMRMRCPRATILGTANLTGWELLFKGSKTGSYLTIEECEDGMVPVVIWEVTESDEAALDRYEGFPTFYYKKDIKLKYKGIRTGKRRTVTAFAYIMHEDRPIGIPSNFYMRTCLIRLAEVVNKKQDKRVVSVSVIPTVTDCSGTIWFTDLQLQEGSALTGYAPHTEICLKESDNAPVWFNGVVRSEETVILLNLGGTSAGLDIHLYPKQRMDGGTVTLAQGVGGQKATFPNAMNAGDDVALLASTRECTRNGVKETKDGFYQYSAAWDSKHIVSLPQGKSAQLLYSMQEMDDGGELL